MFIKRILCLAALHDRGLIRQINIGIARYS